MEAEAATQISPESVQIVAAIFMVAGLAACFWGYRIFRIVLGLTGFAFGAGLGCYVAAAMFNNNPLAIGLCALVGGIIGGTLLVYIYHAAVFLSGVIVGGMIGGVFAAPYSDTTLIPIIAVVVGAVIGGLFAAVMQKAVVVVITAVSGSLYVVVGVMLIIDPMVIDRLDAITPTQNLLMLIGWFLISAVGLTVQYRGRRRHLKRQKPSDKLKKDAAAKPES